jgi:hypothetical protein
MFRFKSSVAIAIAPLFLGLCFLTAACSGDSGSSASTPTSPTAAPAPALNVAGAWTGNFRIPGESECCSISWTATQTGASVSGPVRVDVGEGQIVNATLTGTVAGSQLTSATFTVAVGAIPDPSLLACGFSGTGTLTATTSSISGPLAMTFPPACVGEDGPSRTSTATWTFSLAK